MSQAPLQKLLDSSMHNADFRTILAEFCAQWNAPTATWRTPLDADDEDRFWIRMARCDGAWKPEQGWKLHVSAGVPFAEEVLRHVLPVLLAEDAPFKIAATHERLTRLNDGRAGLSQIGKFITIYPNDDVQAVRLAMALHQATYSLRGPAIPSDRPLVDGSLVHYRYGGFKYVYLKLPGRLPISVIANPDGDWVEDVRATRFQPPAWAADPFEHAGLGGKLPEPHPLIGGRYLLMGSLQESARGGVFWGVDLTGPRRVVLKRGARNAAIEQDGRDARDRLRHEAAILKRLAPDSRFPTPGELIEHDDDLYFTMEDITGPTFHKHVTDRYRQGLTVPGAQVAAWGRELAALLGAIHAQGLIYSDLKSTNIVVAPTGQLRLLDFDFAYDATAENPLRGGSTVGYRSPQQTAHAAPAVTDDVYGLGALLYFAATGVDPMEAARPQNLLERPIALLNPAIGSRLVQVIGRCLAPDAAARFSTMTELDETLAALAGDDAATIPPSFGDEISQPVAFERYHETARQLGDKLCREAKWRMSGRPSSLEAAAELDLSKGSAGILLALTAIASELKDPVHREVTAELAQWLRAIPRSATTPLPGLYYGEAGRAVALLRAGQILGDSELITAAAERGHWIAGLPHDSPDLTNGAAGRLRFHLLLWDETREDAQLRAAIRAGGYLLGIARQIETGPCWQIPAEYGETGGNIYLGYAHGAAGIGDALMDLYDATGETRFLDAARGAAHSLMQLAVPALEDGSGLNWPPRETQTPTHAFWCHGAAGIGKFFLHAAKLNVVPGALEIAARAARTVARGTRWAELSQCHGLAGNIEFLLDMYQATGDHAYWAECESLARLLLAQIVDTKGVVDWGEDTLDWLTADYMLGYAGVAVCLLRLSDPEHLPHQLSRQGFRVQPRRGFSNGGFHAYHIQLNG